MIWYCAIDVAHDDLANFEDRIHVLVRKNVIPHNFMYHLLNAK